MKILKIEFQNINSLKGFHEVDFTRRPFTASSLFAITGPTGSGKSTLLDVISLALFNQVPRLGKISKTDILSKGAILTRNQKEAYAKVTYSCKSGIYESLWGISTNSRGNLRDYEMQLFNAETGEAFDLKKSDVPSKNEALIGLNYNQFIKSVLLAQGEFSQFLRARKEERGEMLEKITGTGIYRQLGQKAFDKFREVNGEILQQQTKMELIRPKLLESEKQQELVTELKKKEAACDPLEGIIARLEKEMELQGEIRIRQREIGAHREKKEKAEKELTDFESAHGLPLKRHEKLRPCAEELRSWSQLKEELEELARELQVKESAQARNLEAIARCLRITGEFTGAEVSAENITEQLETFSRKVGKLQDGRKEKLARYESLKQQLTATLGEADFQLQEKAPEESLRRLKTLREATAGKIDALRQQLGQLELKHPEKEKQNLRTNLKQAREAQQKWVLLENLSAEIKRLSLEQERIEVQRKPLPEELEKTENQVALLARELEILQLKQKNKLLRASLEEHRVHLKNGEACPLCGALEHPYSLDLPELEDSLEAELREKEALLKQQNHQMSRLGTSLLHLEDRLKELQKELSEKTLKLQSGTGKFGERFGHLRDEDQETDWGSLCRGYELQLAQLEQFEKENRLLQAVLAGIPLHEELNVVLGQGLEMKRELDALYSGKNIHSDCRKLQDDWITFSQEQNSLKEQQQHLREKTAVREKKMEALELQLEEEISDGGFRTIQDARATLLPDPEYHRLHSEREKLREKIETHRTSLKLLCSQLEELRKQESGKSAEESAVELQEKKLELQALKQACEEIRRLLRNDLELQEELKALREETAEKEKSVKRWRLLNELIGDAKGKKFNDFAQDLSLSQLLRLANIRLKDLSDRYQLDKPGAGEDDGLVAIDEHMGGQRRSVKTLSGGETFILSLAMALALSDLASRNVEINSLFIDEGFGTLDPETLDQTLDTLEKLQAESSKTIGIISHVDSLKERIATQVKLERNGQGYSHLTIRS